MSALTLKPTSSSIYLAYSCSHELLLMGANQQSKHTKSGRIAGVFHQPLRNAKDPRVATFSSLRTTASCLLKQQANRRHQQRRSPQAAADCTSKSKVGGSRHSQLFTKTTGKPSTSTATAAQAAETAGHAFRSTTTASKSHVPSS
jgi:hypothetical protein